MNVTLDQLDESFTLPEGSYYENEDLDMIRLPEGLRAIGPAAFAGCTNLQTVYLPDTLLEISEGAFLGCTSLNNIQLPPHLSVIGDMAFWGSGLERIVIPESVTQIGDTAFWDCPALSELHVPNPDVVIGKNAFGSCPALRSGYLAPGIPDTDWPPTTLLYVLLWCSCPDKHTEETSKKAEAFIRKQEAVVMEHIIKANNIPAMNGLVTRHLLDPSNIDEYLKQANGLTEITALLLAARTPVADVWDAFEL
ncbi:MAG: leucine-rich repeat protein [Lachnospiraceae bacterium]|nr:leucine-rich repeat protein [Lachnospiraceae bacterium]